MAKATAEKPAFDVSLTDKRSDKRVVLDYVFAQRYAPDLIPLFDRYAADIEAVLATEGLGEIHTQIDTQIAKVKEDVERRLTGEYADYELRGNGASFWLPKSKRPRKTDAERAQEMVEKASPEQLEALAELLKARGVEI